MEIVGDSSIVNDIKKPPKREKGKVLELQSWRSEVIQQNNGVKSQTSLPVKVGPQRYTSIETLSGIQKRFPSSDVAGSIFDVAGFRELPYKSCFDFSSDHKNILSQMKSSLSMSQVIRTDNAKQRNATDKTLNQLTNTALRDPRPLCQQFAEMNADQLAYKIIQLELEERCGLFDRNISKKSSDMDSNLGEYSLRTPIKRVRPVHELIHSRLDVSYERENKSRKKREGRLTAEQRAARLMSSAEKEILKHRSGHDDTYDEFVEKQVSQSVSQLRKEAVQATRDRLQRLLDLTKVTPTPAQQRALLRKRRVIQCSITDLKQVSRETAAAARMSSWALTYFGKHSRYHNSTDSDSILRSYNNINPVPMVHSKAIQQMTSRVEQVNERARFIRRRIDGCVLPDSDPPAISDKVNIAPVAGESSEGLEPFNSFQLDPERAITLPETFVSKRGRSASRMVDFDFADAFK